MHKKVKLAASSAAIALLLPLAANAINQNYAKKLERSGCTQASELKGCDINKTKAENAKAGFVATPASSAKESYQSKLERSGCTQASELQGCDINKTKAENAKAGFVAAPASPAKESYQSKLERSGCTQASELQGCDINKTKAENAKAGFGTAEASGRSEGAPAAAIQACNKFADQGYNGTIVSQSAMKPGYWEVVMRFEQYQYACNVSSSGKVESFNKIN